MSTLNGGPGIVTDGLVLCLDAANPASYTSGSTVWNDLSRSQLSGSLVNGPTFSSANGGSIVFDRGNDTVLVDNIPINTNLLEGNTVEQWTYWKGGRGEMPFSWFNIPFSIFISNSGFGFNNGSSLVYGTPQTGLSNIWIHCVYFFPNNWSTRRNDAQLWINGEQRAITLFAGGFANRTIPNPATISIGSGYNNAIGSYDFNGNIATTKIYNRALTADEVLQNFNAQKSRFGF
jgi:hypothetical protein